MKTQGKKVDKFFLVIVCILVTLGIAMFISASLGILNRNEKTFYLVLFNQLVLGLGLGLLGMYFCLKINYKFLRKYALFIFLVAIGFNPGIIGTVIPAALHFVTKSKNFLLSKNIWVMI